MIYQNFNQTKTLSSLARLALLMTLLVAIVALMGAGVTPTQANPLTPPSGASTPLNAPAMLQFTSGGHILGFQADKVYLAGLDHALSVTFVGATPVMPQAGPTPAQTGLKASPHEAGAPPLSRVTYPNLWPGISLTYEAQAGSLAKSTYQVAPGADPGQIHLRYNTPVTLQPDGSLSFAFDTGRLTEAAPVAWQEIAGQRVLVSIAFRSRGRSEIGFAVGPYNSHYPLIIDPAYWWHTFYGGGSYDRGGEIAVDGSGNLYITGVSFTSWNGPGDTPPLNAYSGREDIVVVKLNSSGTYQWHTFYGSSSNDDQGYGIIVDGSNVYVMGWSLLGWNGPGDTPPLNGHILLTDIVVVKLNSSGAYLWHTFYGSHFVDYGQDIAVDGSGNVYVTGYSEEAWYNPLNAHSGWYDIVALKLNSSGTYQWHTFYGSSGNDYGLGIAVDGSGNAYVIGWSRGTWNGPSDTPPLNAFSGRDEIVVLKLNSSGTYQWHTFYGGSSYDRSGDIAVDGSGNVYVTGYSLATWNGPSDTTPLNAHSGGFDIVALKLNSSGTYQWHTFYGSSSYDYGDGIAVDGSGNPYVTGESEATWNGPDDTSPLNAFSGDFDIVALKLNNSGVYQWHTFYGSSSYDGSKGAAVNGSGNVYVKDLVERGLEAIRGIAVDGSGNIYVTGSSWSTWNGPGDTTPLNVYSGGSDIVVVKMAVCGNLYLPLIFKN